MARPAATPETIIISGQGFPDKQFRTHYPVEVLSANHQDPARLIWRASYQKNDRTQLHSGYAMEPQDSSPWRYVLIKSWEHELARPVKEKWLMHKEITEDPDGKYQDIALRS